MEGVSSGEKVQILRAQIEQLEKLLQRDAMRRLARETLLKSELTELKAALSSAESREKSELDLLRQRVKTADTLLSYLKSKARIMTIPRFAHTSCGIKRLEGVGLVDKRGIPMAQWKENMKSAFLDQQSFDSENQIGSKVFDQGSQDLVEGEYIERIARIVMQVTDVMEVLLKRAILAEADMDEERQKAKASQEEVNQKNLQLECMWSRVQEMEKVAVGTSSVLKEMQSKLEDMEQETCRQRQRAAENEQELSKVRHDFGVLRSRIESLVTSSERTIMTLEKRVEEMEGISERMSAHIVNLEAGKRKKEAEVAEFLSENDDLRAQLDFKEAELAAMRQQVRQMYER
ncbi:hypothetical protein KP509_13G085500 [Ceratopteris richardii]|uniref:Uncharacterized protein n=1 Tax=Ceratopteris richardii TaxID=49495 RepID=A0A8T2TFB9_CERRI|nr:hypothetical protein KP509_13G085500 [Ceratopteris richardii]KAH7422000.1 hypothetical protein KP509_13G085500 [Ceratopteris richardii]KAH7422001.1 hypothetical protein KP509_13G085500 [Ceratopteris richardii]KAH7422002.1 hypothetical protein KP509_13G085500 [Ceratopteris richardii]